MATELKEAGEQNEEPPSSSSGAGSIRFTEASSPVAAGISSERLAEAIEVLRAGGMVAFPTETYYGLAVDPFNREAIARLFAVKRRSPDKPILCMVEAVERLDQLVAHIPTEYKKLMEKFWPGPLSLVFPAREDLPVVLTGYTNTIGVRVSSHPVANSLVKAWGGAITATSANLSGQPAATSAEQVSDQLGPDVDLVLDGGESFGGKGSTILRLEGRSLLVLREGIIEESLISEIVGEHQLVSEHREDNEKRL